MSTTQADRTNSNRHTANSQLYVSTINTLAATYEISCTLSVLFSRDIRGNWYLIQLWTIVAQRPHKLQCCILATYISAALYRICARLTNCTAFSVLNIIQINT